MTGTDSTRASFGDDCIVAIPRGPTRTRRPGSPPLLPVAACLLTFGLPTAPGLAGSPVGPKSPIQALHARHVERNWITLQWEIPGVSNAVIRVERRVGDQAFEFLGTSIPGGTLFHDRVPAPGMEYTYRIGPVALEPAPAAATVETRVFCPASPSGTLVAWGSDGPGAVLSVPEGSNYVEVASGSDHAMALRTDGTVVAWGRASEGQTAIPAEGIRCDQIAAGGLHCLALRREGSIAAWGYNGYQQVGRTPPGRGFVKVSGGDFHSLALRNDGTLVCWGDNGYGQAQAPAGTFLDADCGDIGTAAVRADGSVCYWGEQGRNRARVPEGTDYIRVRCGQETVLGIRAGGLFQIWGSDRYVSYWTGSVSEAPLPTGHAFIVEDHGMGIAIRRDGTLECWGRTDNGVVDGVPGGSGFFDAALGARHAVAIRTPLPTPAGQFANGGFEAGGLPLGTVILSQGLDRGLLSPWTASGAATAMITTGQFSGLEAVQGKTWVEFNSDDSPVGGCLQQTFLTEAGCPYRLTYVPGRSGVGPSTVALLVDVLAQDGRLIASKTHRITRTGWDATSSIGFVATTRLTTLRFSDISEDSHSANLALDEIHVDPATAAGFGPSGPP